MAKIKSLEELRQAVARNEELIPQVLVTVFRIVDSYPPRTIVGFTALSINEIMAIDVDQVDRALHTLEDKGLIKLQGFFHEYSQFQITDYGRESARDFILQRTEEMRQLQSRDGRQKVFIIHGHDEDLKKTIYNYIQELGLQPVVLHEVPDEGRTVIEKLERVMKEAQYAVSLWSPDDTMADGSSRARQNVILETGMFCTMLTRQGVRILIKGDIEIPSDLSGVLRTHIDDQGKWKKELNRELIAAGLTITTVNQGNVTLP